MWANQSLLLKRFAELAEQADAVEKTQKPFSGAYSSGIDVDNELYLAWSLKARSLIGKVCGEISDHYKEFIKQGAPHMHLHRYDNFKALRAVFMATREDFEGGYLNSFRNLIQADVFSNELDQARELFKSGYFTAAAVIAGVVLETTLRQLCVDRGIDVASLNKMNADLTKDGCYNQLKSKQITALADIRNNAAHGNTDKFTAADVSDMISKVEDFVAERL